MKKFAKLIALILCASLCLSACNGKPDGEEETTSNVQTEAGQTPTMMTDGKITLPYNNTDGINPFFAQSYENIYLCKFLYESLFAVDRSYSTTNVIAESIAVNEKTATVRIQHNVLCRDNSPILASDVVYSFNMAKESYYWGNTLRNVVSATVQDDYTVVFTLGFKDIYVAGKLDFPIVKTGTADTKDSIPVGSGDYTFSQDRLVNIADTQKVLYLAEISDRDSAEDAFNIGMTDVFFNDLSNCDYSVTMGKVDKMTLGNMVYLGINNQRGALDKYIRNAIAAKLDADSLVLSAYQGHGKGNKLPVSPDSILYNELVKVDPKGNKALANNIIDRCGYTRYAGEAKTNGAYTLSMSLIVNIENQYRVAAAYHIADSLEECGFLVSVQVLTFDEYNRRISAGEYDMYLGEVKLDGSMDISMFFAAGTVFSSGIDTTQRVATDYFRYRAGELTAAEYYSTFVEFYPFIPLAFRTGYAVTSADVTLNTEQMPFSLYNGI